MECEQIQVALNVTEPINVQFAQQVPIEVSLEGARTIVDWGSINGTLSNQTDLQNALNSKQDSLGFTPENVANKSTDTNLGSSDILYPTQKAVKTYADNILGNANALVYKGVIDCSTNPNYPESDAGHLYAVSIAGKIGGASGIDVEVGDMSICNTDGTSSGDQATVGTKWNVIQKNIVGAVTGPASSTDGNIALFDGTSGKIIKNSSFSPSSFLNLDQTTPQTITATDTTITASDEIYFGDATDSFKIKKDTIQGILDLTPAPDLSAYLTKDGATAGATTQSQSFTKGITLNATSIVTDTTTGLKIGTGTIQKIGFYNNTPIVKPTATTDLGTVLSNLGLRVAGTAFPISTSGKINFSGIVGLGVTTITNTSTNALKVTGTNGDVLAADTTNMRVVVGGTNKQIGTTADPDMLVFGTDLITANAPLLATDKIIFTQTDGNEYIDSLNDGYLDLGATTGIRLKQDTTLDEDKDLILSGTGFVDSPSYKAGGTSPVSDGTYTVGIGGTTNGTITIKGGIITAVQEAVA